MAAQVAPLQQLKLPSGPTPMTAEQRYWKTFKNPLLIPSPTQYPVTHITAPPAWASASSSSLAGAGAGSDYFAVTTGTRVQIYSARTRKLVKTITRFGDIARSGDVRRDGRIVVAGDDTGKIQVFDVASRAILKTWAEHRQPVWTTRFSPGDLTTLMSASDDKTVRLWDLPAQRSTTTFVGHDDYVRTAAFMPGTMSNMLASGSYDSTVRLWDPRAPRTAVMTFKHAAPVEQVLPLPAGTTLLAAAENHISVLDLVAAKPQHLISNHQKTVTALSLASGGRRLVSGGLDGHVKIFETTGWNVVAGTKYTSPILSLQVIASGANQDDRHLAVGMQSGVLSLRTRLTGPEAARDREREKEMQALLAGTIDAHDRAKGKRKRRGNTARRLDLVGEGADVVIANDLSRAKRETPWQKDLRHGRFAAALDRVLDTGAVSSKGKDKEGSGGGGGNENGKGGGGGSGSNNASSLTVLTLLMALRHRSGLREALAGRDEDSVQPVLRWVQTHIADPRYLPACVDVATHLLDLYAEFSGHSAELAAGFRTLHRRVRQEVERAQVATQTGGMLSSLLVAWHEER